MNQKISSLEDALDKQQRKEKQLLNDMKRKGDLARQIIAEKEQEIAVLKKKAIEIVGNETKFTPTETDKGTAAVSVQHDDPKKSFDEVF